MEIRRMVLAFGLLACLGAAANDARADIDSLWWFSRARDAAEAASDFEQSLVLEGIVGAHLAVGDIPEALRLAERDLDDFRLQRARSEVAVAQAKTGDASGAIRTGIAAEDEEGKVGILVKVTRVLARAGQTSAAREAAYTISDPAARIKALLAIAGSLQVSGQSDAARQLLASLDSEALMTVDVFLAAGEGGLETPSDLRPFIDRLRSAAREASDPGVRAKALMGMYLRLWLWGDLGTAGELAQEALPAVLKIAEAEERDSQLEVIAGIAAMTGDAATARRAGQAIGDEDTRQEILTDIPPPEQGLRAMSALDKALAGDLEGAERLAQSLPSPLRDEVIVRLVPFLIEANDLGAALRLSRSLPPKFGGWLMPSRDKHLKRIAIAHADAGDLASAVKIADEIGRAQLQAQVLIHVARQHAQNGMTDAAIATSRSIGPDRAQDEIDALLAVASVLSEAGDAGGARQALRLARDVPGTQRERLSRITRLGIEADAAESTVAWIRKLKEPARRAWGLIGVGEAALAIERESNGALETDPDALGGAGALKPAYLWRRLKLAAAELGPQGQEALALELNRGVTLAPDQARAAELFAAAAEQGELFSQYMTGLLHFTGEAGVEQNTREARRWLTMAAEKGQSDAQWLLAELLFHIGFADPRGRQEAIGWLDRAAHDGHSYAQADLGVALELGEVVGIEQDLDQAAAWYQKAADKRHLAAAYNLGRLYDRGDGVDADLDQAQHWYGVAAEGGHERAAFRLALLLDPRPSWIPSLNDEDDPTERSVPAAAVHRYEQAARLGHDVSYDALRWLAEGGNELARQALTRIERQPASGKPLPRSRLQQRKELGERKALLEDVKSRLGAEIRELKDP